MAADHAGGRTGRIQQDALEGFSIPPAIGVAGVGRRQRGLEPQALQVLLHALQALGLQVQGDDFGQARLVLEDVTGLAARCATGVQYTLTGFEFQQRGGQLRRFVLHADPAFGETGQLLHIAGCGQANAVLAERASEGFDAGGAQLIEVGIAVELTSIDPQHHRRMDVIGSADGFPVLRPMRLERFLQPTRVRHANHRIVFQLDQQCLALALGAA